MKILLGADQYPEYINGAANFTARLGAGLAGAGHTIDLLWPSATGEHYTSLDRGVRVHRLSSITLPGRPRMQLAHPFVGRRQVEQILEVAQPDVVHVQSHLTLGRALVQGARAAGVPVVATNHFMPENLVPHIPVVRWMPRTTARLAWRDLEKVFASAEILTAPTRRAVDLLAESTSLPAAEAVSCGVELFRYSDLRRPGADTPPSVLFVGRLEPEKHVDLLLQAFALLPPALDARLEIVGMGSLRAALEDLACRLGIATTVTFAGAISDDALLESYARADLFAMPGTAELQSIATLEAMAAGLPVVAADAMALPHLVHHGENGYLHRPGDVDDLSSRIHAVLTDPKRADLGHRSRQITQQHDLTATLGTFIELYSRVVRSRRPITAETQSMAVSVS